MKGSVYQRCSCRDPETKKTLGAKCPKLRDSRGRANHKHGAWYFRYEAPAVPGEPKRRRPEVGPFADRKTAEDELAATIVRLGGGAAVPDRGLLVRDYLANWLAGMKLKLKPLTYASYEEAVALYFAPGVGHLRLVDLRDHHLQDLVAAMLLINQPLKGDEKPAVLELLRRLVAVRADDARRVLPEGEKRRKKSTKPLSPSRVERIFAVLSSAITTAIETKKVQASPLVGVVLPAASHPKPLPWTPQREARFRDELDRMTRDAEAAAEAEGRMLTREDRQRLWTSPGLSPVPSMVWMPEHAGAFLDYLDATGERLAVLFIVTMFCGLRRDEVLGLTWAEVDLDERIAYIRETQSGDGPKTEAGIRIVPLPPPAVEALRAWRKQQLADRLAWGPDWADRRGLVFTREDGTEVPGQWTSNRFETLAFRTGLVPVRFHDLRHGTASLMKAAKQDTKYISAMLGHSRTSFTDSQYVSLFPEIQKAAADAAAAMVPRKRPAEGGTR
jgi:integrase